MVSQGYQLATLSLVVAMGPKPLEMDVLLNNCYGRPSIELNDLAVWTQTGGEENNIEYQWVFFTGGYFAFLAPWSYVC